MRMQFHRLFVLVIIGLFLSGCQVRGTHIPAFWQRVPEQPLYALRGGWYYSGNNNNTLFIIDPETWSVVGRTRLPRALSPQIDQDPQGRLWIGLGTTANLLPDAKGMLVFSRGGRRLAKLDTCKDPITGVEFGGGKAYVVCALNGFSAQIDIFDLKTLKKIDSMPLDAPELDTEGYTLLRSGGTSVIDDLLLVFGLTDSIDDGIQIANGALTLVDTTSLEIMDQTEVITGIRLMEVLPYRGKFYGLNYVRREEGVNSAEISLFIIEPGSPMEIMRQPLALSDAMRGEIDGDILHVLHSGTHSEPLFDEGTGDPLGYEREGEFYPYTDETNWQALSTYHLVSGETDLLWFMEADDPNIHGTNNPYPDASDITLIDGEIVLISNESDHIYRWNRVENVMEPVIELKEAGQLLLGDEK